MAGRADIKAGAAYVELSLKGTAAFAKGLKAAGDRLKDFGTGMAKIGGVITAAGAGLLAPFAAAVNHFAEFGSALNDMSARTGASAQLLAELGHAAEMTGATMEDVEIAMKGMVKKGLNPANFKQVAAGIAVIEDPTERAQKALETFGKSGLKMLPLIEDLDSLSQQANMAGLVPTDAQVKLADELGDSMDMVKKSVMGVAFQVGAALAESVIEAANAISRIVQTVASWVKQNKELVVTIAKVGVGLLVAGGIITGLGLAIAGVGLVLSGIVAAVGALATVLGTLASPIGVVSALLIGGVAAWLKWSESGKGVIGAITGLLWPMVATFKKSFQGITDAVMSGDLALAGKIAMAGLNVAILQGIRGIANAAGGAFGDFVGTLGKQILSGDLSGAWNLVCAGIQNVWAQAWEKIVGFAVRGSNAILKTFESVTKKISSTLMAMSAQGGAAGAIAELFIGKNPGSEVAKMKELIKQNQEARKELDVMNSKRADRVGFNRQPTAATAKEDAAIAAKVAEIESRQREIEKARVAAFKGTVAINKEIENRFAAPRADLAAMNAAAAASAAGAQAGLNKFTKGGGQGANDAVDAANAELNKLIAEAAKKRAAGQQAVADAAAGADAPGAVGRVSGTFSASAAAAMGQGRGPIQRVEKAVDKMAKQQMKDFQQLRDVIKLVGVIA